MTDSWKIIKKVKVNGKVVPVTKIYDKVTHKK
jgi:hypothetical protein